MRYFAAIIIVLGLIYFLPEKSFSWQSDRAFSESALDAFRNDPAFDYSRNVQSPDNWIGLLILTLIAKLNEIFATPNGSWISANLFRLIILVLIILGIYLIVKMRYGKVIASGSKSWNKPTHQLPLVEERVDYHRLYQDARDQGEWRLAIRYLYLITLVTLHEKQVIKLEKWKTALDYIYELNGSRMENFRALSKAYELSWYGDIMPEPSEVDRCQKLSNRLLNE